MTPVPAARHLLRAKDLVDARFREPLDVRTLARAAHLSLAHFSREFRRTFGETPHQDLLKSRSNVRSPRTPRPARRTSLRGL